MSASLLVCDDVSVRYGPGCGRCPDGRQHCQQCGAVHVVAAVSLDTEVGEVLGMVGESGSGKSTLLRVAGLELAPTAGRLLLEGVDVTGVRGQDRRRLREDVLGMVHQPDRSGLLEDVTAGGNVAARLLAAEWREYDRIRARVAELFDAVELPTARMDTPVSQFSGGMRQRVQLARVLAPGPGCCCSTSPPPGWTSACRPGSWTWSDGCNATPGWAWSWCRTTWPWCGCSPNGYW